MWFNNSWNIRSAKKCCQAAQNFGSAYYIILYNLQSIQLLIRIICYDSLYSYAEGLELIFSCSVRVLSFCIGVSFTSLGSFSSFFFFSGIGWGKNPFSHISNFLVDSNTAWVTQLQWLECDHYRAFQQQGIKTYFYRSFNSAKNYISLYLLESMRYISAKNCCKSLHYIARLLYFYKLFSHQSNIWATLAI